jgi:steroid delta-isomerase-like uncharacterized protein
MSQRVADRLTAARRRLFVGRGAERALPDVRFTIDDLVLEGERAVILWTARGTHRGSLMNIPPSNQAVAVRGVSALTLRDGKIIRGLYIWDVARLLRNIGLSAEL